MKGFAITYPVFAFIAICYWVLWLAPVKQELFGPDGSLFFIGGFYILGITAIQSLLWAVPIIRKKTSLYIGTRLSYASAITVILLFCWGSYMVASIFIYGI